MNYKGLKELLTWLNNETTRNNQYHNHKETMAWIATALYLTGIITTALNLSHLQHLNTKILVTLLFSIITFFTIRFLCWQFKNRDIARLKVKHLSLTILELLMPYPNTWPQSFDKHWLLPDYILNKIKAEKCFKNINKDIGASTKIPKIVIFSAVIVAAITFIISVWFCVL